MQTHAGLLSHIRPTVVSAGFPLLLSILACLLMGSAHAEVEVPPLKARVTDLTNTLDVQQRDALEQKLAAFEAAKGSQIAVLIVPTTQPEAIEQYSIRVAEQWKLGRKGVDDGVLLLVAKDDRKMRLEVGRGLEGAVPDAVAKRITSEIIAPYFKNGDFHGGIAAGVDRLIRVAGGESLPKATGVFQTSRNKLLNYGVGLVFVLAIVCGLITCFRVDYRLRIRLWRLWLGGAAILGGAIGVFFWTGTGVAITGIIPAIIVFAVSFFILLRVGPGALSGKSTYSGSWSSGSSGGSSSSSSSSSFSGGGGDFGGGGASSDW